ncbi:flagellar basal-body MS-ring/collar protein FliF [Ectobacillus ponti]|uniref:Flagellar M-ring protein FliF n=1 Tax=Ectobacillus ponti TaxID=2961894 RepID=A0AA42BQV1_9BACI|nr:flagellar basal-body MS-ring/collar protein FliF [Ectobacillus ponti]MCP8968844.1 flagellar M-ring protein FliF [Ectobacillus ponti]
MEKLKSLFQSLKTWHKMVIAAVLLAVITIVSLYYTLPGSNVVLYSNLTETDKQDILTELSKLGVKYEIDKNGSITVPQQDASWVRSDLTEKGLPSSGDGTSGDDILLQSPLGTSEQDKKMREIVGIRKQLETDIVRNLDGIQTANVQINLPDKGSIFDEQQPKGSAAVTLGIRSGTVLTENQVKGIQYMVSSAVSGVKPEEVSVIDSKKGVISANGNDGSAAGTSGYEKELAIQQQMEDKMKSDIEDTLVNIFNINNFHVNTKVTVNFDEIQSQSEKYGDKGVLRSKQEQKDRSVALDGATTAAQAGVSANGDVPGYNADTANGDGKRVYDQSNDNTTENYEIDKTVETVKKHPELANTNVVVWVDEKTLMKQNIDINAFKQAIGTAAGLKLDQTGNFVNGQVNIMQVPFSGAKASTANKTSAAAAGTNWWLIGGIGAGVLAAAGAGTFFLFRRKKKQQEEQEDLFVIEEEKPAYEEAAAAQQMPLLKERNEQDLTLDEQVKKIAKDHVEETARVMKKWLNG